VIGKTPLPHSNGNGVLLNDLNLLKKTTAGISVSFITWWLILKKTIGTRF